MPRFTPSQRIRLKSDFDAAYRRGNKIGDTYFLFIWRPNGLGNARLGLSISARTVGIAVNRNRIKRVIRESFRQHQHLLPAIDVVVNSRAGAREADNAQLFEHLTRMWNTVVKRCSVS